MEAALDNLKQQVADIKDSPQISDEQWQEFVDNTTILLMAGGEGSRFKTVTKDNDVNKNSFKLPNDDTMFEMTLRMYAEAGFKDFVALVYHHADSIEDLLGDGSTLGVNLKYSYDPEKPIGKGGAVLNALLNGSIPEDNNIIVHNPDDLIINYSGSFPRDIVSGHIHGVKKGGMGTVVVVEETAYPYTGMQVVDNKVENIEMYPKVPIPTHIGVTLFSPDVFPYFKELFSLEEKSDFEKVLFPVLSRENRLFATSIPNECWLAVNNPKAFKQLVKYLNDN